MFSKQTVEMLFDLIENRISDAELYQPSGKAEYSRLRAALDELLACRVSGPTAPLQRRRGRPSKAALNA